MSIENTTKNTTQSEATDDFLDFGDSSGITSVDFEPGDFMGLDENGKAKSIVDRIMQCHCPKCSDVTEIDLTQMSDNGFVVSCASCKKPIHVLRESCAGRAKRKSVIICCVNCGKTLDQHAYCHSCGIIFPDYFVPVNPDDARRQARSDSFQRKWETLKNIKFSMTSVFDGYSSKTEPEYNPQSKTASATAGLSTLFSRKVLIYVASAVLSITLIVGGGLAYQSYKSRQVYAERYFQTLYCIKTGIDTNIGLCESMRTEWDAATASGKSYSPIMSNKAETEALKLRSIIDKLIQQTSSPPKKFVQANEKLLAYHHLYTETETVLQTKPRSSQELGTSVENFKKASDKVTQELKSNLPGELKKELVTAKLKYRGLNDF